MEIRLNTLPKELPLPPQYVTRSPPQYFTLPTTMAAVGPRGRGKTYNLCLWNKWMFENEYFTRFFVISPTYESNDPLKTIPTRPGDVFTSVEESVAALQTIIQRVILDVEWFKAITETYSEHYEDYLKHDRNISRMDRDKVSYLRGMQKEIESFYEQYELMNEMMDPKSKSIKYTLKHKVNPPPKTIDSILGVRYDDHHPWFFPPPKLRRPVPLLFIDDCSHSPIYAPSRTNPLVNLTLRHRHLGGQGYGVSIQFAVQTFKSGVPKALRQNTMQFLIFKTADSNTVIDIYEEVGAFCRKEEFLQLYDQAIQGKHDFLLIDLNAKDESRVFRRNWDTFLVIHSEADENEVEEIYQKLSARTIEQP
jgi:hypothetical protein